MKKTDWLLMLTIWLVFFASCNRFFWVLWLTPGATPIDWLSLSVGVGSASLLVGLGFLIGEVMREEKAS